MKTLSIGQQTKIQRGMVRPLNEACNIINGFELTLDESKRVLVKRTFEEVGMINILANFDTDETRRTIKATKKRDGKIISNRRYITGAVPEADAEFYKGLYIVDFNGLMDLSNKDRLAEMVRGLIFIGIKRENGKFRLVKDLKDADLVMMPYAVSPSLIKHSRIYYAAVDKMMIY